MTNNKKINISLRCRSPESEEPEQELEAQQWIEQVVGERFPPGVPYEDVLRDGIFLCKLMNKLQPGIISKNQHQRWRLQIHGQPQSVSVNTK